MATRRTMMGIHDDQCGEGQDLAFPAMGTCAAVIAVLPDTMVGIHKTQNWRDKLVRLFGYAKGLINNRPVLQLIIAGWNTDDPECHDVGQIRGELGCEDVPTWVATYTSERFTTELGAPQSRFKPPKRGLFRANSMTNLCTFAYFNAGNPRVGVKRSTKVNVIDVGDQAKAAHTQQHGGLGKALYYGIEEPIETPSEHLHWLRKNRELQRWFVG